MKLYDENTGETVEVKRTDLPIHLLVNGEFVEYEEGKWVRASKVRRVETLYSREAGDHPGKAELELAPGEGMGTSVWSDLTPLHLLSALNMALENGRKEAQP